MQDKLSKLFCHEIQEKRIRDYLINKIKSDYPDFEEPKIKEWRTKINGPQADTFIEVTVTHRLKWDKTDYTMNQVIDFPMSTDALDNIFI